MQGYHAPPSKDTPTPKHEHQRQPTPSSPIMELETHTSMEERINSVYHQFSADAAFRARFSGQYYCEPKECVLCVWMRFLRMLCPLYRTPPAPPPRSL